MNRIIIYYKELPKPVKYGTCIYIGSLLTYNLVGTWLDAKDTLIKFREDKLDRYGKIRIRDEWEAVKHGANSNFGIRFVNSIIWPVRLISDAIPFLVLKLNPPETKNHLDK